MTCVSGSSCFLQERRSESSYGRHCWVLVSASAEALCNSVLVFTIKPPWHTSEDTKSSTVVEAFELATERRAREWQEYERLLGEKEALRARMEVEQRREEEQKVKEEITKLRQEQVTK